MKTFVSFGETFIAKKWHINAAEIAAGYSIFQGIYHYSHPVAWIVLGVAALYVLNIKG